MEVNGEFAIGVVLSNAPAGETRYRGHPIILPRPSRVSVRGDRIRLGQVSREFAVVVNRNFSVQDRVDMLTCCNQYLA